MLVKNYYDMLATQSFGAGTKSVVSKSGASVGHYPSGLFTMPMLNPIGTTNSSYVQIGTGTDAPTFHDYYLSGSQITTVTSTYSDNGFVSDDNGWGKSVTYTITNTGSEAFTIGEIALFYHAKSWSGGSYEYVLMDRTVLDTPLTIEAGGIGQLTYTIRMNYPTA